MCSCTDEADKLSTETEGAGTAARRKIPKGVSVVVLCVARVLHSVRL